MTNDAPAKPMKCPRKWIDPASGAVGTYSEPFRNF